MPESVATSGPASGRIAQLVAAAMRRIQIPRVRSASGSAGSLQVGRIALGNASLDRVEIGRVNVTLDTGQALLGDVRAVLSLRVGIRLRVRIAFVRINASPSVRLPFRFDIGTVNIPRLDDIALEIRGASVRDATVAVQPITDLDLGGARFSDLRVEDTLLPAAGFGLAGLDLGAVRLNDLGVPALSSAALSVGSFTPDAPFTLPSVVVSGVQLPVVRASRVSSTAPINIPNAQASEQERVLFNRLGVRVAVFAQPTLHIQIGSLLLNDIDASASINGLSVLGIRAPVTIHDVTIARLRLEQLTVDRVTV